MKYKSASGLLPEELIARLQDFVQGEYLYIPAKKDQRKAWGTCSGARKELDSRNRQIRRAYAAGASCEALAGAFHLSAHAIKKIIYQK